jgi:HAD superfamily phosphatase (TIGR01668 family)
MLSFLTPHLYLDSVLDLPAERFRSLNRSGLLLDLDCTLKDYHAKIIGEPVVAWVRSLQQAGTRLCLLSNGKPRRIAGFARELGVPFVAKAFKPLPFGCHAAMRTLGLRPEQTAVVGDQLFADVLAGRLAGLLTILVRPTSPLEPWFTRLKRPLERQVLKRTGPRARFPNYRF